MTESKRVLSVSMTTPATFGELYVDITGTITGLKALQREAKKATQALRELEATQLAVSE